MAFLKKAIKDNVMTGQNKYMNDDEKIGLVIETNEPENRCTIFIVTREGVSSAEYNVPVKCDKFPDVGDYVEVTEQFKKFTIVGIYDTTDLNTNLDGDIYCMYGGAINGYVGY